MENGLIAAKFITYITLFLEKQLGEQIGVSIDKLQTLKVNSTNQAKLYNWNVLGQEIEILNVFLSPDQKRAIIEGDHASIIQLLMQLKDVLHGDFDLNAAAKRKESIRNDDQNESQQIQQNEDESIVKPKPVADEAAIDIDDIKTEKSANECSSCVEYILLTLSQALKLTPKQSAGFLAKDNKFLTEACIKGLKNGYEPITDWYQLVYSSSRHLSNLISQEIASSNNALSLVMNTLK